MPCSTAHCPIAATSASGYTLPVGLFGDTNTQRFGARCACGLELLDGDAEPVSGSGGQLDRDAVGELDRFGVRGPVGRGQQHLVARVEQGLERVVDRVLAAVGDEHLVGGSPRSPSRASSSPRSPPATRATPVWRSSGGCDGSLHAAIAASTIAAGVGKSGSPAPKPMTSSPSAFNALYFASTARVADSAMASTRREIRLMLP